MIALVGRVLLALVVATAGAPGLPSQPRGVQPRADDAVVAADAGTDAGVSVVELDLTGVTPAALPDLPALAPVPDEQQPEPETGGIGATVDTAEVTTVSFRSALLTVDDPVADQPVAAEPEPDVLTAPLDTAPFSVVGVTWDPLPAGDVVIRYRVRQAGEWTDWDAVAPSDVGPDADGPEGADAATRGATDPIVAVDADGLQIWAESASATVTGLKAVLIDPGEDPAGVAGQASTTSGQDAAGYTVHQASGLNIVPAAGSSRPAIITRAGWGADESMRTCEPDVSTTMVSAAVHHTASTNSYAPGDVAGLIRGFYAYHTRPEASGGRGWCDIGYNFLVDKFGRIFEGRAGGMDKPIVGVHTGGFNSRTIGVAAIGDYSAVSAPAEMVEAISQIIAWKFSVHRIFAGTTVTMVSGGGASKYPAGTAVTFSTIYGHRDAQLTSCPGQVLYNFLPQIRARVAELTNSGVAASPYGNWERTTSTSSAVTLSGWMHDPGSRDPIQVVVEVNGVPTTALADGARPDVERAVATAGPRTGFSVTVPLRGIRNVVCLSSRNVGAGYDVVHGCRLVTVADALPIGHLDAVTADQHHVRISGWALDRDTPDPINVAIYVNGRGYWNLANIDRPDVGRAYPDMGSHHGFALTVPGGPGSYDVCAVAINNSAGSNTSLGCRTVAVASALPTGRIETVTTTADSLTVGGWALDRDTTDPINLAIYVDGRGYWVLANAERPDVARAFPGVGDRHGFRFTAPVEPGRHEVCVVAVNSPGGPNVSLGCQVVDAVNSPPIGQVDAVAFSATGLTVSGWALDRDTIAPINVAIYVNGRGYWNLASYDRPDVARAHPGLGSHHGYALSVPAGSGRYEVCVAAVNRPAGPNTWLGCKAIQR